LAEPIAMLLWGDTRVILTNRALNAAYFGRQLANITERSVLGGDAGYR